MDADLIRCLRSQNFINKKVLKLISQMFDNYIVSDGQYLPLVGFEGKLQSRIWNKSIGEVTGNSN